MNGKITVEIMLSTYNGEKYLREQMDSLLSQKGDFTLKISVRDDGSRDGTLDILREYEKNCGINLTCGQNIGINAAMLELVKSSEKNFDYFAFSDQDDVWEDFKISEAITALSACEKHTPALFSCMEVLTDENLKPYETMPRPKYYGDFYNAIIQNKAAGHTQVFNGALRDMFMKYPPEKMYVYDWVNYIIASEFGMVFFSEKICGKYRQHGKNSLGYSTNPLAMIPLRLKRLLKGDFKYATRQLKYIYEVYGNALAEEHKRELERFLACRKKFWKRLFYALTAKVKRNTVFESFQFRTLYFLGVYGKDI
ncbi:MAG: glycosyltransferase [Clostridiales bacterium]|nr:glycosyltransferase [Clostridiales bacterium]